MSLLPSDRYRAIDHKRDGEKSFGFIGCTKLSYFENVNNDSYTYNQLKCHQKKKKQNKT